jgi:uncharacterized membrane protein YfhO
MSQPEFDPRSTVVLEECVGESSEVLGDSASHPPASFALQYRPNGVTIRGDAPAAGYIVLADTAYPGWQATVDGKAARVWTANFAFRAVAVEAGAQTIDFHYRPVSLTIGAGVSLLALVSLLAGLYLIGRRR